MLASNFVLVKVVNTLKLIRNVCRSPCVEFSMPENALTLSHGSDGIVSSSTCGYYSNRYWPMWKLPMFGCANPDQVLAEIAACKAAFPGAYIRVCGFDPVKQVQATSMLVHRPPNEPAIDVRARSVDGTGAAGGFVAPLPPQSQSAGQPTNVPSLESTHLQSPLYVASQYKSAPGLACPECITHLVTSFAWKTNTTAIQFQNQRSPVQAHC